MAGEQQAEVRIGGDPHALWRAVSVLVTAAWTATFFLYYVAAFDRAAPGHDRSGTLVIAVPLAIVFWQLTALVHEAGHLLGGLSRGWRPLVFVVRPIAYQVPARSIAWRWREKTFGDARGWVGMVPSDPARFAPRDFAVLVAGGPIASALLAAIAFLSARTWLPALDDRGGLMPSFIAYGIALQALYDLTFTLLPHTRKGATSDGDKLRRLRRADDGFQPRLSFSFMALMAKEGVRSREIPQWMIDTARRFEPDNPDIAMAIDGIELSAVLDAEIVDTRLARRLIDRFRAFHGDGEWIASADAWCAAMLENDLDRAWAVRWDGEISDGDRGFVLLVDAAIAAREGDGDATRELLDAMDRARRGRTPFRDCIFEDARKQVEALLAPPA